MDFFKATLKGGAMEMEEAEQQDTKFKKDEIDFSKFKYQAGWPSLEDPESKDSKVL